MLCRVHGLLTSLPCLMAACVVALGGGLMAHYWTDVYKRILLEILQLTPDGARFQVWKYTPVPVYIEFSFFNWTNPEELQMAGKKPSFVEIGPYRFTEKQEKTEIVWNDNDTISFKLLRRWYFDPENSRGSLSDEITTINMVSLAAAYILRDWNQFLLLPLSQILKSHPLAITHNVSQFLFEGFDDPLLRLGKLGSVFDKAITLPHDKCGWFYKRNGSQEADGHFNMATGASDMSRMGDLLEWNYKNTTSYYPGKCGRVTGSTGDLFAMGRKREPIEIYSQDLCRPMLFDYSDEVQVAGLNTYQYTASLNNIDNGTLDAGNECFCGGECVPFGVANVSECKFGGPFFISYPHFYQADPYYLDQVDGLKPDKDKHSFLVNIEPATGVLLDIVARLQVNFLIQPYKSLSPFANLPKVFFPMMWFTQRGTVTPDLATGLQMLLLLSPVGLAVALVIFALGLTLCTVALLMLWNRRRKAASKQSGLLVNTEIGAPLMAGDMPLITTTTTTSTAATTTYSDAGIITTGKTMTKKICLIRKKNEAVGYRRDLKTENLNTRIYIGDNSVGQYTYNVQFTVTVTYFCRVRLPLMNHFRHLIFYGGCKIWFLGIMYIFKQIHELVV